MKGIPHRFNVFLANGAASATVEFVIALPVLLTALVFAFEFGRAFFAYEAITADVEAAVRYISHVPAAECLSLSGNNITNAENLAQCGTFPQSGAAAACTAPKFPWNSSNGATLAVTSAGTFTTPDFNNGGNVVQVRASVPMSLALLGYMGINTGYTLVVADQARCMGN